MEVFKKIIAIPFVVAAYGLLALQVLWKVLCIACFFWMIFRVIKIFSIFA